jgi:anthranilate/para-aminobenzoate synthase component II
MHGKTSDMYHDGKGVFANIPSPFRAVRYHSLAGTRETLPSVLEVTCTCAFLPTTTAGTSTSTITTSTTGAGASSSSSSTASTSTSSSSSSSSSNNSTTNLQTGMIQGARHTQFVVEGVQFHPESILTEHGRVMLKNFLDWDKAVR